MTLNVDEIAISPGTAGSGVRRVHNGEYRQTSGIH